MTFSNFRPASDWKLVLEKVLLFINLFNIYQIEY